MAYEQPGVSRYGHEVKALFSSPGTRYTFYTTEELDYEGSSGINTTGGSTTLMHISPTGVLKTRGLNSTVHQPPNKEWPVVSSEHYNSGLTVPTFINDTKMWGHAQYTDTEFVVSSSGSNSYTSGAFFDNNAFKSTWYHDVGWDRPPTIYSRRGKNATQDNKAIQLMFAKAPSPRWFRKAASQKVLAADGSYVNFLIYTDVLSRFYILPTVAVGTERYSSSVKYSTTFFRTHDISFEYAVEPKVTDFHGSEAISTTYVSYYDSELTTWFGDFDNNFTAESKDKAFDGFMGGTEGNFEYKENITPSQYLWTFNFNATKATTVAYAKGDPLTAKDLTGEYVNIYKYAGSMLGLAEGYKDIETNSVVSAPKLRDVKIDQVFEYYPVLIEVEISITAIDATNFTSSVKKLLEKSSLDTQEWYISSGYSHPEYDANTNKYIEGFIPNKPGYTGSYYANELRYLTLQCYGTVSDFQGDDKPHDSIFTELGDSNYVDGIPEDELEILPFVELVLGDGLNTSNIEPFILSIPGIQDFFTQSSNILEAIKFGYGTGYSNKKYAKQILENTFKTQNVLVGVIIDGFLYYTNRIDIKPTEIWDNDEELRKFIFAMFKGWSIVNLFLKSDSNPTISGIYAWNWSRLSQAVTKGTKFDGCSSGSLENMVISIMCISLIFGTASTNSTNTLYGIKSFGSLLSEYLTKFQLTEYFYKGNVTAIQLACQKYIVEKVCAGIGLTQDTTDNILGILAQSLIVPLDNCVFSNSSSSLGLLDSLNFKIPSQVIEGILVPNTVIEIADVLNSSFDPFGVAPTIYSDFLPDYGRYEGCITQSSNTIFGRKIHDFKSVLSLRNREGGILNNFSMSSSDYVCARVEPLYVSTFNNLEFDAGDRGIYSHRVFYMTPEIQWNPNIEAKLSYTFLDLSSPYAVGQGHYWAGNKDGSSTTKNSTNSFIFSLFTCANENTKSSNLCASDLASSSFIFYSAKANYHYPDVYSVGSTFIANNSLIKSTGIDTKEGVLLDSLPNADKLLDVKKFNMIYSLSSVENFIEDIPVPRNFSNTNKIFPNGSKADPSSIRGIYVVPTSRAIETHRSSITSHPNGSIAAYSLPPFGFLDNTQYTPDAIGDYSGSMTIDYIKAFYKTGFIYTTHKDEFNKAFNKNRDYSAYTDPTSNLKYGGFCSAGVWYDFNLRVNGDFDY